MSDTIRLDKWLWFSRFFKTRSLAARALAGSRIRVNGTAVSKSHQMVRAGDVLTFPLGLHVRVIRIEALGVRRGPAPEAGMLYTDLDPPQPRSSADGDKPAPVGKREPGTGRPTKTERRALDRLRDQEWD